MWRRHVNSIQLPTRRLTGMMHLDRMACTFVGTSHTPTRILSTVNVQAHSRRANMTTTNTNTTQQKKYSITVNDDGTHQIEDGSGKILNEKEFDDMITKDIKKVPKKEIRIVSVENISTLETISNIIAGLFVVSLWCLGMAIIFTMMYDISDGSPIGILFGAWLVIGLTACLISLVI